MNLAIEFRKCAMNLDVFPEKTITGESLAIESNFLKILQNKIAEKEESLSIWCDVYKKEMRVWLSTYDNKEIPKLMVFKLILYMNKIFGEHRELRYLGLCANYDMKTYSDGVSFCFKNYLVHINSNIILKGLKIKYWNCHFCEAYFNFSSIL